MILPDSPVHRENHALIAEAPRAGLGTRPAWLQRHSHVWPANVGDVAHLLFDGDGSCRPDALLIEQVVHV